MKICSLKICSLQIKCLSTGSKKVTKLDINFTDQKDDTSSAPL